MAPPAVVKHLNVIDDIFSGRFSRVVDGIKYSFGFQTPEETLSYTIVPTIPLTTHAACHPVLFQEPLKIITAILAASI